MILLIILIITVTFKSQIYNLIILLYVYKRVPGVSVSFLLLLCVLLIHLLSVGAIDDSLLLMVFWILTGLSVLGLFSQRYGLQPLTIALIIRSIYHLGLGNTLILLGSLNVRHTVTHSHSQSHSCSQYPSQRSHQGSTIL